MNAVMNPQEPCQAVEISCDAWLLGLLQSHSGWTRFDIEQATGMTADQVRVCLNQLLRSGRILIAGVSLRCSRATPRYACHPNRNAEDACEYEACRINPSVACPAFAK